MEMEPSSPPEIPQTALRNVAVTTNCQQIESTTPPSGSSSSVISVSTTPSPPPTTPCASDDDRSDCSGKSETEVPKKKSEQVEILFAPTTMAYNEFAKLELPQSATEVPAPTSHKSSMRVFLPSDSIPKIETSPVPHGSGGENKSWYNIEYKCFRMKSSEANAYISKLHDHQVKVQYHM